MQFIIQSQQIECPSAQEPDSETLIVGNLDDEADSPMRIKSATGYEAYDGGSHVEYWSSTHAKWPLCAQLPAGLEFVGELQSVMARTRPASSPLLCVQSSQVERSTHGAVSRMDGGHNLLRRFTKLRHVKRLERAR